MDRYDLGLHVLGGQAWSLITLNRIGIIARQENIPQTIDTGYIPGFSYTRNPQFRIVKDFDDRKLWLGLSAESPQAIIYNSGLGTYTGNPTTGIAGGSSLNSSTSYTLDPAPDLIAKLAYDPGYGHYEVYGITRFFRDRYNNDNHTIVGGGGGAGAILPIIDKKLEFQISGLAGTGVGRYGPAQLPDVTMKPDGRLVTIDEGMILTGLTAHPDEQWDLYLFGGMEKELRKAYTVGAQLYGYGTQAIVIAAATSEGSRDNLRRQYQVGGTARHRWVVQVL